MVKFRNMRMDSVWFYGEAKDCDSMHPTGWEKVSAKVDGSYNSHTGSGNDIEKAIWCIVLQYRGKKLPDKDWVSWG